MGYYTVLGLKCKTPIGRSHDPKTNISNMIEKCNTNSLCKGIVLPNCNLHNDSKKLCQVYEEDNSTNQTECSLMKSK